MSNYVVHRRSTTDFIRRTNEDYAAWCKTYYEPEALDERGFKSLHGLWAWQEQERRKAAATPTRAQINAWMMDAGWQNSSVRQADLDRVSLVVQAALTNHKGNSL